MKKVDIIIRMWGGVQKAEDQEQKMKMSNLRFTHFLSVSLTLHFSNVGDIILSNWGI